jgi:hypothetical protein
LNQVAPAYARISGGTSQTGIVDNTWTKVNSTTPTVTNPLGWTISAGGITIPGSTLPGMYSFYGFVQWDSNATGVRVIQVAPTSSVSVLAVTGSTVTAAAFTRVTVSGVGPINSDITLCLSVLQTSGTNRDLAFNNADFVVARVSPLT